MISWRGDQDQHCSVSHPGRGEQLLSLFTSAQNGKVLRDMKVFKDRLTAFMKCLPKRTTALAVGDLVVGLVKHKTIRPDLPSGTRGFTRVITRIDTAKRNVEVFWSKGMHIVLCLDHVALDSVYRQWVLDNNLTE